MLCIKNPALPAVSDHTVRYVRSRTEQCLCSVQSSNIEGKYRRFQVDLYVNFVPN